MQLETQNYTPTPDAMRNYEAYFDYAELCNQIPLCFDDWQDRHNEAETYFNSVTALLDSQHHFK